jgi:hypothetical protein
MRLYKQDFALSGNNARIFANQINLNVLLHLEFSVVLPVPEVFVLTPGSTGE